MDGLLNVYKPSGITSHDVVMKVRKKLNIKQIGHLGTLDPLAEGVLVLAIGNATKLIPFLENDSKSYVAEIIFGISTTSYDLEGDIIASADNFNIDLKKFDEVLEKFVGEIQQTPPIYSAVKVNGKKLYEYARQNKSVDIPIRNVTIYSLKRCSNIYKDGGYLKIKIEAVVSKGTYIRSLCKDIGDILNIPSCMGHLVRTRCGNLSISDSVLLEQDDMINYLISPIDAINHLPIIDISNNPEIQKKIDNGMKISPSIITGTPELIVFCEDEKIKAVYKFVHSPIKGYQAVRVWK